MEPWSKADQMQCNNRGTGLEKQVSPSKWPQRFRSWQEKTGGEASMQRVQPHYQEAVTKRAAQVPGCSHA